MVWTLSTSGSAIESAGANVNSTIAASGSALGQWSSEAESMCCNECDYDVVTNYGSLTAQGKTILASICSSYIGQKIIGYEPEAIGTTGATLRLNLLQTNMGKGLSQIKDSSIKAYLTID